jgi:uncharacterized protein (DUF433 family)
MTELLPASVSCPVTLPARRFDIPSLSPSTKNARIPPTEVCEVLRCGGGGNGGTAMTESIKEPQVDIGQLIAASPDIRRNRPRIAGTGVTVQRVVGWYKLGLTPEEISDRIGHLNLAQVHAALAYYHANREQVEADLATEEAEDDEAERAYLARRQAA